MGGSGTLQLEHAELEKALQKASTRHNIQEKLYTTPPPSPPYFGQKAFLRGRGGGVYMSNRPAAGILYAAPLYTPPPPLEGYFQGWGGEVRGK